MDIINEFGINFTLWAQSIGEWPAPVMLFFSFLGTEGFYLFVAPALYWCISAELGLRMGLMLMISSGLNNAFKILFHSPRPYWVDERVTAYSSETSFGIPSGHSQNSVVFWGTIAYWVKRKWFWLLSIALMFMIGFSRIFLGVHFIQDVLIGWTIGAVILIIYILVDDKLTNWIHRSSNSSLILAAFLVSIVLIILAFVAVKLLGDWSIPQIWIDNAIANSPDNKPIHPISLEGVLTTSGAFFGMASGAIFLRPKGGLNAGGSFIKRVLRFIVGLIGIILLYWGMKQLPPLENATFDYIYRYIRYAVIGFWITGAAPLLFFKIRVAEPLRKV